LTACATASSGALRRRAGALLNATRRRLPTTSTSASATSRGDRPPGAGDGASTPRGRPATRLTGPPTSSGDWPQPRAAHTAA
jgi:hypothetical protein